MVMENLLLFLYAESPIHAGGSESLGAIDLPIQREVTTGLPVIWGQSLKGALRERAGRQWGYDNPLLEAVFGSAPPRRQEEPGEDDEDPAGPADRMVSDGGASASPLTVASRNRADVDSRVQGRQLRPGTLQVGDAQLVALPVPTLRSCFAWATSPLLLSRLARKSAVAGLDVVGDIPELDSGKALGHTPWAGDSLVCGPFVLTCTASDYPSGLGERLGRHALPDGAAFTPFRTKLSTDTLVVDDGTVTALATECVEVTPRVQLKQDEKTVEHGPFYSESLPAETLLASVLTCTNASHRKALVDLLQGRILRIGGNETIGKGLAWCRIAALEGEDDEPQASVTSQPEHAASGEGDADA
jgi:CRISPR-associated protein Cmr4